MRKLRNYFVMLTVVIMAVFNSSCKSDDSSDEELGPFVEYSSAQSFYDTYMSYSAGDKVLIDTREASAYNNGHLKGALNFPATVTNTASDDASWCKDLLGTCSTSQCLFFYGTTSFQMTKTVAGRASRIGYGKQNSRIYSKGYDEDMKKLFGTEK